MGMDVTFHGVTNEVMESLRADLTTRGYSLDDGRLQGEGLDVLYRHDGEGSLTLQVQHTPAFMNEGVAIGIVYDALLLHHHMNHQSVPSSSLAEAV